MGVVIRQGFKFTVVTYVGVALGALNILVLFPGLLDSSEIGLRELLIGMSLGLAYFAQLAMNNVMVRFYPWFKDESRQDNGLLLLSLLISLGGYLLISSLFYFFTPVFVKIFEAKASLVLEYLWAILPLTAFSMLNTLLENWARLQLRISVPALIRELILRLIQTAIVLLYGYNYISFYEFILAFIGSYAFNALLLVLYVRSLGVLYLNPSFIRVPVKLRKEMAIYAVWMLIGGAGVIINERIDGLMLAWLAGLSYTGIYAISFFIATIIEMPRRGVSQLAGTLVAKHWKDGDFQAMALIYKQSSLNQIILGGTIFIGIWANIDALFELIPNGEVYSQGKYVVFFIGLARLVDMANGVNNEIIQNSPHYRFNLISILFLGVISFTTNYYMIPIYGLTGAAAGSTISIVLFNTLKGGFIWTKLRIQPFEKRSVYALFLLAIVLGLSYLIPQFSKSTWGSVFQICMRSMFIGLSMLLLVWRFKLSDELHGLIENVLRLLLARKSAK
jgi:O-antigen/teichoic acid export membrane protein